MWDVLLEFDVTALSGAAGNAGAEWDGTYFYFYKMGIELSPQMQMQLGTTMIEQFSIPGVTD
ncbi:MAG: hypothetical protein U5J96_01295 [Ignavibacteriaceae bacterium]|nr:hypothetical protein [Ignavibacteriaceae bacterium]